MATAATLTARWRRTVLRSPGFESFVLSRIEQLAQFGVGTARDLLVLFARALSRLRHPLAMAFEDPVERLGLGIVQSELADEFRGRRRRTTTA